jgi:hypothetical protein
VRAQDDLERSAMGAGSSGLGGKQVGGGGAGKQAGERAAERADEREGERHSIWTVILCIQLMN